MLDSDTVSIIGSIPACRDGACDDDLYDGRGS